MSLVWRRSSVLGAHIHCAKLVAADRATGVTKRSFALDAVSDNLLLAISVLERCANGDYSRDDTPDSLPNAGLQEPAQPSPTLGDALNADYLYLEVRCLGCDTHQTVALDIIRRSKGDADPRD